jgi:hypothetical protein
MNNIVKKMVLRFFYYCYFDECTSQPKKHANTLPSRKLARAKRHTTMIESGRRGITAIADREDGTIRF